MPQTATGAGAQDIAVQVVGWFGVRRHGRDVPTAEVGSRKSRTLLALLAVERGPLLSADRLVDLLWDGRPRPGAGRNLSALVSRLRATFGPAVVVGGRAGYRLGDDVRVDLDEGARLVTDAESALAAGAPGPALAAARAGLAVLGAGGVLDDQPAARWADPARTRHAALLRGARHAAAEAGLRAGDPRVAQTAAAAAVADDVLDEAACRALMQGFAAAGEPRRALDVYDRLRVALATELGVDPAAPTRELYLTIRGFRATG